jgi:GTP-binding protein HflX
MGLGKAQSLKEEVLTTGADLVIALQELSPVQVRNLSDLIGAWVIDRTDLILDIFAQRAQSREGKLQVELAQLNHLLPRLGAVAGQYSRLGGGIGTRGPGETKLEIGRRRIKQRIADLRREISEVEQNRSVQRQQREKNEIPTIALVGYTNAGKSTLFNRITQSAVPAADRLFDTLDPVARRFELSSRNDAILLDTVGFISDLPHQLIAAFRATLEETIRARVLLHVMDAGSAELSQQYTAVKQVLSELKIEERRVINVLNKADTIPSLREVERLAYTWSAVPVSARTGSGMDSLIRLLADQLVKVTVCHFKLPYSDLTALDLFHTHGKVIETIYGESEIRIKVEMDTEMAGKYQRYLV